VFVLGLLLLYIGYRMALQGWGYVGAIRTPFGFVFAWGAVVSGAIIVTASAMGLAWSLWRGLRWLTRRLGI
jgi:hypothetical protein